MKIAHLGDTHLGYGGVGPQPRVEDPRRPGVSVPQLEADLMRGLELAIDRIVGEVRPDAVVHTGDLFDSPLPSAAMLAFAMQQFQRLSREGIPALIVEGDHSCPRSRSHGHILAMLGYLPGVTVAVGDPATHRVGGIAFHAVPHRAALQSASWEWKHTDTQCANVLVTHAVADGHGFYRTGRSAATFPVRECADRFDYVALGHCHRFGQVPQTRNAFYAGATAMVTSNDFRPGHTFGFNVVDFGGTSPVVEHLPVTTRAMHAYGADDAANLSAEDILAFLARQAEALPPAEAYCRVSLQNVDSRARQKLSNRSIEEIFRGAAAVAIDMKVRAANWSAVAADLRSGGAPEARFVQLVAQMDGEEQFKRDVEELGRGFLETAARRVDADNLEGEEDEG